MYILLFVLAAAAPVDDPRCASSKTDDLLACAQAALDRADAALNEQWRRMPHSAALQRAQKAWLAWRDAECEAENYATGGNEQEAARLSCLADLTDQRAKQLSANYEWM
jgi:uncharacterized protein YecT (DUF1311 family)